jgi:hypothetical protein
VSHRLIIIVRVLFLSIALCFSICYSQSPVPFDSVRHRTELQRVLRIATDSVILIQRNRVDSLSNNLEIVIRNNSFSFGILLDSLMQAARNFLDSSRIDSAYLMQKIFSTKLHAYGITQQQAMQHHFLLYQSEILRIKNSHAACTDCSKPEDYSNECTSFYEYADSSSDRFFTSLNDLYDDASSSLTDSIGTLNDSLIIFVETLMDNREGELDSLEAHSNKLQISTNANSTAHYHGHDGGVNQSVVSPQLSFRHSSGIKLALGTSWLDQQANHWDGTSLGLSYDFTISPVLGGSFGYTHFWFDSSSTQVQSSFNQSIVGELDLFTSIADFSFGGEINFDHQSEFDLTFTATHYWQFGRTVTLAPLFAVSWGEQNLALIAKQIQKAQQLKAKGKKSATKTATTTSTNKLNIFSILDYEISMPVSIRIGRIILTPSVTAVFPLAVFDNSRTLTFLNFGLTATVDWIW